jgi:hypothetical protein
MVTGVRARTVLVGLTACAALGLSACGGSGYEYVSNDDAGLYFRVPEGWSVFEISGEDEGVPEPIDLTSTDGNWYRVLDRSPSPAPGNFVNPLPIYPVGVASVEAVGTFETRDELDYAMLRSFALGGVEDPLELADTADSGVQLIDYEDVTTSGGVRGERIVFTVEQEDGSLLTFDQTAVVDPETTEVYRLLLKCEAHCYESNRDEIDEIVESWTIEED